MKNCIFMGKSMWRRKMDPIGIEIDISRNPIWRIQYGGWNVEK